MPVRRERLLWLAVTIGLCLWAAWRMGAFDLMSTVPTANGSVDVPNVLATVDHPFHATRADTLLESLRNGEILRWVGNHQGGYPAEFYPLGIAWLDVAMWGLLFGSFPIIAVHKLAVVVVFLLPAVAFWLLARGDRLHPGVATLATAGHIAIPGHWLNGGYTELVGWGLVTNVAGGSLALIAAAALARFVLKHERWMGIVAILAGAAGAVSNPRSLFALVIASIAIVIVALVDGTSGRWRRRALDAIVRIAIVGGVAVLLTAPVVLSLMRYQDQYFFLHYNDYDPLSTYWEASLTAVSRIVVLLAIAGAILPWVTRHLVLRATSLTLAGYVLFTVWVATSSWTPPLVEQLEAPRLMPFQRQVMIYLAAAMTVQLVQLLVSRLPGGSRQLLRGIAIVALALTVLVCFVRPLDVVPVEYHGAVAQGSVPETYQSLSPVSTTGNADFLAFRDAVRVGEAVRQPGTSMFVIGNRDDWWHEQLWAPTETAAPLYYDDWLWYWTTTHKGPYDFHNGHSFPNPTLALTPDYLGANGISVVLVTDMYVPQGEAPRQAARSSPDLAYQSTIGQWDVYLVREPTSIVTNGEVLPTEISVANHRITANFTEGNGTIVVRRNWFPRWQATANGDAVEIERRDDGYMEVHVPEGPVEFEIVYAVTGLDWAARAASVVGVMTLIGLTFAGGWLERRFGATTRESPVDSDTAPAAS